MDDGSEVRVYGTILGYERFLKSVVWGDIKRELAVWSNLAVHDYDAARDMIEVAKIQGRREALAYFLQLPENLLQGLLTATSDMENEDG